MAKKNITTLFRLFTPIFIFGATVISKTLYILYIWAASDITVPDAFKYIFGTVSELFGLFSVAAAISAIVYAHSYFGKKTTVQTSLISLGCLALGKVIMFVYNLLANSLSAAQIISGALSYIVEILFDALVIIIAIAVSYFFARKRITSKRSDSTGFYSPSKAVITTSAVYTVILAADLTFMNVIPFFMRYSDPTAREIGRIITDYMYYLIDLILISVFAVIILQFFTKITGKLRLKEYYKQKSVEEN